MQISSLSAAAVLAASTLVAGELHFTNPVQGATVPLGAPLNITWTSDVKSKLELILVGGWDSSALEQCGVIADGINNIGSMIWDVATTKPPDGRVWYCNAWLEENPATPPVFAIDIYTITDMHQFRSPTFKIPRE